MRSNLDIFSDDQAITGDAASTNAVYVGAFAGRGEPVTIRVRVTEAFTLLTSLHLSVTQCATEGGSYTDVVSTPEILLAALVVGYEFLIRFLPNVSQPWVKLHYECTGTDPDAGKIAADVVEGEDFPFKDGLYFSPRNPTGAAATA
jgi:hypothetical protein